MSNLNQLIEARKEQIKKWKEENVIGFTLWKTNVVRRNFDTDEIFSELELECHQCKDGVYILQTNIKDSTFLIYKCQADICQKTVKR